MSDVYDEILNSSNIQGILEYYGIKINKNKCICPFHSDTHPSMSIHPNKGIVKCFACGTGGNAISFIQKYENEINHNKISFRDAMQKAIDIQHLNINIPKAQNENSPITEEQKKKQKLENALMDFITLTEANLNRSHTEISNCLEHLRNRKISNETIKHFHIGYAPQYLTISKELLKHYSMEELENVGIINNKKDVFSGRITIPIFAVNGKIVGFGARAINDSEKPKYLNTKETEFFNKSNLLFNYHKAKLYARNDELIIVEGYMDVISAKQMKVDNVVGTMGTALTKEHINLIKKLNCEITLCLDNDQAGKEAMIRIIPELLKQNLKVSVLDISRIGNYKDFGDLQIANITKEEVYSTKISAFTFLLQYQYIKGKELTVENINDIYQKMVKNEMIKNTKDALNFREFMENNTSYTSEEIEQIINPTQIEARIDKYKDIFFYNYILELIKKYAIEHQNQILLKYIESNKLTIDVVNKTLNDEKYLQDEEKKININSYIEDYIFKTNDYIEFKNDKVFILEKLLNNVKIFNSKGNVVDINLTIEQKEIITKQYNESFSKEIKEYVENNLDEFEEIFISNNINQFKTLFPRTYEKTFKEQAISNYSEGSMEAIRYALAYTDEIKSALSRQYVNNGKYKTLLVFNNNKNILQVSEKQIENIEIPKIEESIKKNQKKNAMSIFVNLSGEEKETYKGMYLPISKEIQVFIPKQLYRKENERIEILNDEANQANMSEYKVDVDRNLRKWSDRLTLDDFYKKYSKIYEVQREKEVMV